MSGAIAPGRSAEAFAARASLQFNGGDSEAAICDFRNALKLDPTSVKALNGLAWVLAVNNRNLEEALALAKPPISQKLIRGICEIRG
jgi:Flp pilus assembly protein TadD